MAAKTDMERVALFQEMGYHTIGDPYRSPGQMGPKPTKGRQLLPGGDKEKSALVDGYFSQFTRVFEKEAYSDPVKMRMQQRKKAASRNLDKSWNPASFPKKPAGLGSYFGTFAGRTDAFSPAAKSQGGYKAPAANLMTSPPKKGTGYGYIGVTLGKYPDYKGDKYEAGYEVQRKESEYHKKRTEGKGSFTLSCHPQNFFDANPFGGNKGGTGYRSAPTRSDKDIKPFRPTNPAKKDGGMKAGTFDPFPTYSSSPYKIKGYKRPVHVVNSSGRTFVPNQALKSAPHVSTLNHNIHKSINSQNYQHVTSVMSF